MNKFLLTCLLCFSVMMAGAQTTYYWVGGTASANINTGANWNTSLDGSGSPRPSSSGATDVLVFNGANVGGATPTTGVATVHANAGITCAQMKFINNAAIVFVRNSSGTSTLTLNGDVGEDFVIESGSSLSITSPTGSIVIAMAATSTGRVSGNFSMITPLQARIANTTSGTPGSLIFTSGANFYSNITAASAAYPFGNSSQSSEKWVIFQSGSNLYYDGGFSPMASSSTFSPIDFQTGSVWHHRVSNPTTGFGSFFNNKSFATISVENSATLTADGPINKIENLIVNNGSSFITHTTGTTVITGNMTIDGTYTVPSATRNNILLLAGTSTQTISGSGSIAIPYLTVADQSDVVLNKNITALDSAINIYGKINFNGNQLSGAGTFTSRVNTSITGITGTLTNGSQQITATSIPLSNLNGLTISGAGIPANTVVTNFSSSGATINLSKAATASGTAVALTFVSDTALLETSNSNGMDSTTGSVIVTGTKNYQSGTSYIIDAATTKPFGISSGSTATHVNAGTVTLNASVTTNTGVSVYGNLNLNSGKTTIRALDTLHIISGATLTGNYNASNYFVTAVNGAAQGILRIDGIAGSQLLPVGTATNYLPATINPSTSSDFAIAVFQGITDDGTPNGTALTAAQKQTKLDAVWNINRINGTGNANLQLQWTQALEGSTFTTLTNADIGIITNQSPGWALPITPGDNTLNIASASFSSFGAFSVGAQPPAQAFVFNTLPVKTYGDADFNGGAFSANTTQPIVYSSSNPAVATIVSNNIHIVGVGTTVITASQATDGFYPAISVPQTLTVNKAALTITADDKSKPQGDPNPALTISYTGFVNGETASVLTTPVAIATTAVTSSPAGTYPITVSGATSSNYTITFVNGLMTVTPRQNQTITFNAFAVKTYGNNDFGIGATSSNATIPVTYVSSNTNVATIVGNNIHIVGAGTSNITASQAGNAFYYAAPDVTRTLTVNKANLTVKAADTSKIQGQINPPFRLTYSGFVLGETTAALTTIPTASTMAVASSPAGYYSIDVAGGASNNYNFIYTSGRLTVYPLSGINQPYVQAYMSDEHTLSIKLFSPVPDLGDVIVFDMSGRIIMRKNVFIAQGFLVYTFPIDLPASGIYIIHAIGKNLDLKITVPVLK